VGGPLIRVDGENFVKGRVGGGVVVGGRACVLEGRKCEGGKSEQIGEMKRGVEAGMGGGYGGKEGGRGVACKGRVKGGVERGGGGGGRKKGRAKGGAGESG